MIVVGIRQSAKASGGMQSRSEPSQNETVRRREHRQKQDSPKNVTNDGMLIVSRFRQVRNARASIENSVGLDPKITERIDSPLAKQDSPIVSISSRMVTFDDCPKYRTSRGSVKDITKSSLTAKYRLPLSISIRQFCDSGRLLPVIFSTEAGMQICFKNQQPRNAADAISRSRDPGSKVTASSAEMDQSYLSPIAKHCLSMNSTDAAMHIERNAIHGTNVPRSSGRICESASNSITATDAAVLKKSPVRTVRDAGITVIFVSE
jgi:hypothetical protein